MYHAYNARRVHVEILLQHSDVLPLIDAQLISGEWEGKTALIVAAFTGQGSTSDRAHIVEMLLDKGADLNHTTRWGKTALHLVRDAGTLSILLDRGADVTALDHSGWRPLTVHAWWARPAHVEILLEDGRVTQELINARATRGKWEGAAAVLLAATANDGSANDRARIVEMLLDKGALVNMRARFFEGNTILHAVHDAEVLSILLERGADITALNDDGQTPLMYSITWLADAILVELFLKAGRIILGESHFIQHINSRIIGDSEYRGRTALLSACLGYDSSGDHDGEDARLQMIIEVLLLAGADPTIADLTDGMAPLDILQYKSEDSGRPLGAIAVLERALLEPDRTYSLFRARYLIDTTPALANTAATTQGTSETKKRSVCVASMPNTSAGLRQRLGEDHPLPEVEVREIETGPDERQIAVLRYLLPDEKTEGMKEEVFVDFLDMIAPRWDPYRSGVKGIEGGK